MSELKECLEHGAGTCRNADLIDTLRAEIARRDEIIARLKEDAERLADIADMFGDDAIAILKHRALMKELE